MTSDRGKGVNINQNAKLAYRVVWNEVRSLEWAKKMSIDHGGTLKLSGCDTWFSHFVIERSQNPWGHALSIGYICPKNGCISIVS